MANDLWLNLPVKDLTRSIAFYEAVGFKRNLGAGNSESSACFLVGDKSVVLMLFLDTVFSGFAVAPVSDAFQGAQVLISMGAESRDAVDALAIRAYEGGGEIFAQPRSAGAGMYGCGFQDPDGHRWNILYMDPSHRHA